MRIVVTGARGYLGTHAVNTLPTRVYLRKYHPEAELRPGLEGHASPVNSARAENLIGFVPEYSVKRQT